LEEVKAAARGEAAMAEGIDADVDGKQRQGKKTKTYSSGKEEMAEGADTVGVT
jgi:hypothetical protein